jgi:hypothetical protein
VSDRSDKQALHLLTSSAKRLAPAVYTSCQAFGRHAEEAAARVIRAAKPCTEQASAAACRNGCSRKPSHGSRGAEFAVYLLFAPASKFPRFG